MATRVRDWATVDYYALLGIDPGADAETVTRAYREQAKQSHPDATDDAAAAARFTTSPRRTPCSATAGRAASTTGCAPSCVPSNRPGRLGAGAAPAHGPAAGQAVDARARRSR